MRFLTCYINPETGKEYLGTGANRECFHRYANVQNVIRFGLKPDIFPAGQYNIYQWPEGGGHEPKFIMTAYKQV